MNRCGRCFWRRSLSQSLAQFTVTSLLPAFNTSFRTIENQEVFHKNNIALWAPSCRKDLQATFLFFFSQQLLYKFVSVPLKHQIVIGYCSSSFNIDKPLLDVLDVSTVPLDVLKEERAQAFKEWDSDVSEINLAKNVRRKGRPGIVVEYGSEDDLPTFREIHQICILQQRLFFVVKTDAWVVLWLLQSLLAHSICSKRTHSCGHLQTGW